MTRARAALVLAFLALSPAAVSPPVASGTEVSRSELAALLAEARAGDPAVLAELSEVTAVDGEPVTFAAAIGGASEGDLEARLREAERSLAQSESAAPGMAGGLEPPPEPEREESSESDGGGGFSVGLPAPIIFAILAAVLIAGLLVARLAGRQRVLDVTRAATRAGGTASSGSPRALERDANSAESAGDFAEAVRLRFTAGLIRLDEAGALRLRPSLTPSAAARETGSATLEALAGTYSGMLYGGRQVGEPEARQARESWPLVLREAGDRG